MGHRRSSGGEHHTKALFQAGRLGDLSDAVLLERSRGLDVDPAIREAAFTALVERHGRMVLRVCEVVIGNFQEAEDAFQATFLVLAREARRLTIRDSLAPWLHSVAVRISLYAHRARARRHGQERIWASQAAVWSCVEPVAHDPLERAESIGVVQSEIARLPKRLRSCVVLCDLEGMTYAQAARHLNLPLGTVQSRLARARSRLRERLSRRGLGPEQYGGQGALEGIRLPGIGLGIRSHLLERTTRICLAFAADSTSAGGSVSGSITALADGGIRMFFISRLKRGGIAVALFLFGGGLAVYSQTTGQERIEPPRPRGPVTASPQKPPLPEHALTIKAPSEVRATGGRGRLLIYELDPEGERTRLGNQTWKEVEREAIWAVVTGVVDHQAIRESQTIGLWRRRFPRFLLQGRTRAAASETCWILGKLDPRRSGAHAPCSR